MDVWHLILPTIVSLAILILFIPRRHFASCLGWLGMPYVIIWIDLSHPLHRTEYSASHSLAELMVVLTVPPFGLAVLVKLAIIALSSLWRRRT